MLRKIFLSLILSLALAALGAGGAWAGQIKGTVKPQGLRSPEGILVYVSNAPQVPLDLKGAKFVMDQNNLTFIPHVLPVPVGAPGIHLCEILPIEALTMIIDDDANTFTI